MKEDLGREFLDNYSPYKKYILLDNGEKLYYDILINADSVDYDCLSVEETVSEPVLQKYTSSSGNRVDVIYCNSTLDENAVVKNGAPSYQSIEMMLSVNAKPNSKIGRSLIEKARKDYPLEYMMQYYYHLSLASCLFSLDKKNYPFSITAIMLSRVLRDFYPKAEALSKANDYEHLDSSIEGVQSINLGKITNRKLKLDDDNKEEILGQVCQILIEKLKEKINNKFSTEFIRKIESLGAGKYLNDSLKNKFLDITRAAKSDGESLRMKSMIGTSGIESLTEKIIKVIEKKVEENADTTQLETQTIDISDIEDDYTR